MRPCRWLLSTSISYLIFWADKPLRDSVEILRALRVGVMLRLSMSENRIWLNEIPQSQWRRSFLKTWHTMAESCEEPSRMHKEDVDVKEKGKTWSAALGQQQ